MARLNGHYDNTIALVVFMVFIIIAIAWSMIDMIPALIWVGLAIIALLLLYRSRRG